MALPQLIVLLLTGDRPDAEFLSDKTHTYNKQTSMLQEEFELSIPTKDRPQTPASDSSASRISRQNKCGTKPSTSL
jgi:hypothetical protein